MTDLDDAVKSLGFLWEHRQLQLRMSQSCMELTKEEYEELDPERRLREILTALKAKWSREALEKMAREWDAGRGGPMAHTIRTFAANEWATPKEETK